MSERNEIKRDGATPVHNSGRGWREKGDAKWRGFTVDIKEYSKSFGISRDRWAKICGDAFKTDRSSHPALKLVLGDTATGRTRLAVIEWGVLEDLLDERDALLKQVEELEDYKWMYTELQK